MADYLRTSEIPTSHNETDRCHRECLDVKARTSRLRIKPGIEESELEHAIKGNSKERIARLNDQFQQSIDSYLQVFTSYKKIDPKGERRNYF